MKAYINRFTLICLGIAIIFLSGMDGCNTEEELATFVQATPGNGSTIQEDEDIIVTFNMPPEGLTVTGGEFSLSGTSMTITGPFTPGTLNITLTWTGGAQALTYTVEAPEVKPPPVVVVDPPVVEDPVLPDVPGVKLIVPGKSAAGINIGDSIQRVKNLYGPGKRDALDWLVYPDVGLGVYEGIDGDVGLIQIKSPNKAKTADGLGIGSTSEQVENKFGKPNDNVPGWTHSYWNQGISFRVANNRVRLISVNPRPR